MKELGKKYQISFSSGYKLNEFVAYYSSDQLVDFLSDNQEEVANFVIYIKSRP